MTTAYLGGRVAEAMAALQRAEQAFARQGDHRRAARSAFWLGFLLLGRGELAQGSGWLARARRLLEHEPPDCPEQGYLLIPAAMEQLQAGDHAAAQVTAARSAGIGRRAGEADLVALAQFLQGAAAVTGGDVPGGLAMLDEAMVAAVAGELTPAGDGHDLLRGDRGLPAGGRAAPGPRVDRGPERVVRQPARPGHLHRPVPGPPGRDPAAGRGLAGGGRGGPAGRRAAGRGVRRAGHRGGLLPAGRGPPGPRRAPGGRGRPTSWRAAGAGSRSPGWPCSGWPRDGPTPPRRRSAGCSPRPATGWSGPGCSRPPWRSCSPPATSAPPARPRPSWPGSPTATGPWPCSRRPTTPGGRCCWPTATPRGAVAALRGAWRAWRELEAPYEAARARVLIGLACRELGDEDAAAMELDAARTVLAGLGAGTRPGPAGQAGRGRPRRPAG